MSLRRLSLILYPLLLGTHPACASGPTTGKAGPLAAVVLRAVRSGAFSLSLLPAERTDQDLTWATWSDHAPDDNLDAVSHLALFRRRGSAVSMLWSRTLPGAYEPSVQMLYGNVPEDRKIVLLKYQVGADEAIGSFFSLTADDAVIAIGSVTAQTVELRPEQDNLLWSQASTADPPDCYRLDPSGRHLLKVGCS